MLIPCSQSCIHQLEGYCRLRRASAVTGDNLHICPHFLNNSSQIKLPADERFNSQEPQQLL